MRRQLRHLPTAPADEDELSQLAASASAGDIQAFDDTATSINWPQHEPSKMVDTIRLALSIGAFEPTSDAPNFPNTPSFQTPIQTSLM